jgi:hypothetical protein
VACEPGRVEPGTPGFHRRDRCSDRHGAPLWPLPARSTPGVQRGDTGRPRHSSPRGGSGRSPRLVFDGPMDGPSFRAYVEQLVVPILRESDIVVMDNLPSHKVAGIREAIEAAGPSCATCPRTAQTSTPSNSSSLNSKPCCGRPPPEPSKPSSQQSPKPSPKSVRKSAKTTSQTKAIAANYESRR